MLGRALTGWTTGQGRGQVAGKAGSETGHDAGVGREVLVLWTHTRMGLGATATYRRTVQPGWAVVHTARPSLGLLWAWAGLRVEVAVGEQGAHLGFPCGEALRQLPALPGCGPHPLWLQRECLLKAGVMPTQHP